MGKTQSVTLEELLALNDEILALVRAKVPLPRSLRLVGKDVPGKVGAIMQSVADQMEKGKSLGEALQDLDGSIPRLYIAIVLTGLRTSHLPKALENMAFAGRQLLQARRSVQQACIYPMILLVVAYSLMLGFLLVVAEPIISTFKVFRLPETKLIYVLDSMRETASSWAWIPPAILSILVLGWLSTRSARTMDQGIARSVLRHSPWVGGIIKSFEWATFIDTFKLLIRNAVPLPDAFRLAGETMTPALRLKCDRLARDLEAGNALSDAKLTECGFPPLVNWSLMAGQQLGNMDEMLANVSATYRVRGQRKLDQARVLLPGVAFFLAAVIATFIFVFMLFGPFTLLLQNLAVE